MNARPRCPRCGGTEVEVCDVMMEASDHSEDTRATHRCLNEKCRETFRWTPPVPGFTGSEVVV